jgi:hypothetical protein
MKVFDSVFNRTFTFPLSQKLQVYFAAISRYLPLKIVQCLALFIELCSLFHWNVITATDINQIQYELDCLHQLHETFIKVGVQADISLPWQHALLYYETGIINFGSSNGLCSSITESKHIIAVRGHRRQCQRKRISVWAPWMRVAAVILARGVQSAVPREDKRYQVYISGTTDHTICGLWRFWLNC